MKLLIVSNLLIEINDLKQDDTVLSSGSWLISYFKRLAKENSFEIIFCSPKNSIDCDNYEVEEEANIKCIHFSNKNDVMDKRKKYLKHLFTDILKEFSPDIIHIFGTEYPHSLIAFEASQSIFMENRVIVNIQGLVSEIGKHLLDGFTKKELCTRTVRDYVLKTGIDDLKKRYELLAKSEISLLSKVNFIVGRTNWDKLCINAINPNAIYYHCEEMIRPEFLSGKWSLESFEPHRLFMSQGSYPTKGLHVMLKALVELSGYFGDINLYVAGPNIFRRSTFFDNGYTKIVRNIIEENNLKKIVHFIGTQSTEQMIKQYEKAHIYIISSQIENGSNSLSEAMLCGTPSVCSYTGGLTSRITHEKSGMFFPSGDSHVLAQYIKVLFNNRDLLTSISKEAKQVAVRRFDNESNYLRAISIYNQVCNSALYS